VEQRHARPVPVSLLEDLGARPRDELPALLSCRQEHRAAVAAPPKAEMFNVIQPSIQLAPGCERKLEAPQSSWDGMLMQC